MENIFLRLKLHIVSAKSVLHEGDLLILFYLLLWRADASKCHWNVRWCGINKETVCIGLCLGADGWFKQTQHFYRADWMFMFYEVWLTGCSLPSVDYTTLLLLHSLRVIVLTIPITSAAYHDCDWLKEIQMSQSVFSTCSRVIMGAARLQYVQCKAKSQWKLLVTFVCMLTDVTFLII